MKCEICHKADAETAIHKEDESGTQELYVCRKCAAAATVEATEKVAAKSPRDNEPSMPPLPLMGMILDAAFEIVGRALSMSDQSCPTCGITHNEYRKRSRLGCPTCYETFAKELDSAIFDLHRTRQHVGKVPLRAQAELRRKNIEDALSEAIKGQHYEEAVTLRDRLRQLDAENDREEGGVSA
jgi:protein arginine kinase activator